MRTGRLLTLALLLLAAVTVTAIRLVPLQLPGVPRLAAATVQAQIAQREGLRTAAELDAWLAAHGDEYGTAVEAAAAQARERLQFEDAAGRRWPLLGDYDSYTWLRQARGLLERGSECDAVQDGECRDALALAPLGMRMLYAGSPHTYAIAAVHRLATALDPRFPLPASAFLVPVLVGLLGVLPAFALGARLGGPWGGFVAAVTSGLHPVLLARSLGSDNDVWNVVLPLYMMWAVVGGLLGRRTRTRLAGGLAAGLVAALHGTIWRGWPFGAVVVLVGLAGAAILHAARWARRHDRRVWRAPGAQAAATVAMAFVVSTTIATALAGARPTALKWAREGLAATAPAAPAGGAVPWPSAFTVVSELAVPGLGAIAAQSYGGLIFFAGWLGMLLALLPRRDWQGGHFAVLIGATLLYRFLLDATGLDRVTLIALLALPLAAVTAVQVRDGSDDDADAAGAAMLVAAWLLAALLLSYHAARFIVLLAAPLGLACGIAAGRAAEWIEAEARGWVGTGPLPALLAAVAVLAATLLPLRAGYALAAAYRPVVDRGWVDALEHVRDTMPANTIVNAWWDYGYWIKYYAARRTSSDGGTLATNVPHWIARAQLAGSEDEAAGVLRMLNCGSDARPYPEGARGAIARLQHHGLDERAAYAAVDALVVRDRAGADGHLAGLGLDAAARADVLAATHCEAPPAVLALGNEQLDFRGWWRLGLWRPDRPADAPPDGLLTRQWVPCVQQPVGWHCPINVPDGRGGIVEAAAWPDWQPRRAHLRVRRDETVTEMVPSLLLLAGADAVESIATDGDGSALLLDDANRRVLVGTRAAIASLYVRLMYLDGRGLRRFAKAGDYPGAWGRRVTLWSVDPPAAGTR